MPINPNIALGYAPPTQLESPMNIMAKIQALRGGEQENALRQAQMENYQAEVARRNALLPSELAEARSKAETEELNRRSKAQELDFAFWNQQRNFAASVRDQPGWTAWRNQLVARQPWTADIVPEVYSPEAQTRTLMSADDALKRASPELQFQQTGRGVQGLDPYTGKPVGPAQPLPPKATGTVVNVSNFTPASEEAQKEFMKSTRATYDQLKATPATIANIEKARQLIPAAKEFMGTGGEPLLKAASFFNNRFGTDIKTQGVKDATTLRSMLFTGVLDNLRKLDAQPTAQQQAVLQEALGNIGTDPNALPSVLTAYEDILRDKVSLHNREVQSAIERGVKFPYDPVIKLPEKSKAPAAAPGAARTIVRTGTANGRKVVEYSDGSIEYAP